MVKYNRNSVSDNYNEDIDFVNVDLSCNKLSIQLLANNSITCTKKKCVITNNKNDQSFKLKTN